MQASVLGQRSTNPPPAKPSAQGTSTNKVSDLQKLLADREDVHWRHAPREVLAFYYGWYGNPRFGGQWRHWKGVDLRRRTIGSATDYPVLGPYDSHNPEIVARQMEWARFVGISGFIVSWWGQGDFEDRGMPLLLDTARRFGLKITACVETIRGTNQPRAAALREVLYLLNRYGRDPAWLKAFGRPVVFVYGRAIGQIGLDGWLQVMAEANKKYRGGALFIGGQLSERAARIFDGIQTYNITGETSGMTLPEIQAWAREHYPDWVRLAGTDRISCLTLIPGYDDSKLDRPPPRPITPRYHGQTYAVLWKAALAANPDWILITSWNEWLEGTEIEPSLRYDGRELRTTLLYARPFRSRPPR